MKENIGIFVTFFQVLDLEGFPSIRLVIAAFRFRTLLFSLGHTQSAERIFLYLFQYSDMKLQGIVILSLAVLLVLGTAGCTQTSQSASSSSTSSPTPIATTSTQSVIVVTPITTPVPTTPADTHVRLETTMGNITIELAQDMPITTSNFASLVKSGFYDGIIFHRVIDGFMIQGGDPTGTGYSGPGYTIRDEFSKNESNVRGTIAMANAGPNTGGSQFFINLVDNIRLDSKHPVFGRVVDGMDVVDAIGKVQTDSNNRPVTDVKIIRAVLY